MRRSLARTLRRLEGPEGFDGLFPPRTRRLGVIYAVLTVPVLIGLAVLTAGEIPYVVMFAAFPSVAYLVPCFVLVWLALRRVPARARDRSSYLCWFAGTILHGVIAVGLVLGAVTGSRVANPAGIPLVVLIALLWIGGIVRLTRSRSGRRALSVDLIEASMAVVVIAAPGILIWGDSIVSAEESWYTVPAALATVGMVFGIYWGLALVVRLGPSVGPLEVAGLGVTVIGAANAAVQVAQGISGFTLPVAPILALHFVCSSLLFVVPLYLRWSPLPGLGRLPPQAQVRGGFLAAVVTLAGLPVLLLTTVAVHGRAGWALPFSLGVVTLLVMLVGLRHLAGVRETRRLYSQVEQASEQRRRLLAQIVARADEDRYRMATDLYEQSVAAYSSVVSLFGRYEPDEAEGSPPDGAVKIVRDDLAHRAASRRDLLLATRLSRPGGDRSPSLVAPIRGYLDTLYGDLRPPRFTLSTSPGLRLGWSTETVVLRIVREALANVRQHSDATEVHVTVDAADGTTTLSISDDGVGFDPAEMTPGSGIAAMRAFAAIAGGTIHIDSAPDGGTTVVGRLRGEPDLSSGRHLELIT